MRTLGFRGARIEVLADLPRARRFCERAGFRETGDVGRVTVGDRDLVVVSYRLGL